jgi:hypothetical protein
VRNLLVINAGTMCAKCVTQSFGSQTVIEPRKSQRVEGALRRSEEYLLSSSKTRVSPNGGDVKHGQVGDSEKDTTK